MSSDESDDGATEFAAIDSQAHVSLTMEEANKLHRQKIMGRHTAQEQHRETLRDTPSLTHFAHRCSADVCPQP